MNTDDHTVQCHKCLLYVREAQRDRGGGVGESGTALFVSHLFV